MNHLIKHISKLTQAAWTYKKCLKQGLKQEQSSQIYALASYYDSVFLKLEKQPSPTLDEIDKLIRQVASQQQTYIGIEDAQQLLAKLNAFLQALRPFVEEGMA